MSAQAEMTPQNQLSILVVQLGTEAEVFRSLMALKAVKHLYPETELSFMVRRDAAQAVKRVEWIKSVIETPDLTSSEHSPLPQVALWIDQVIDQNFDILINWTFEIRYSKLAAIATSLIPAVIKMGDYFREEDSTIASYDAWSMYRDAWIRNDIAQDIHTTDIITTQLLTALQIHAGDPRPDGAGGNTPVTSRYFFKTITASIPETWATRPKNIKWVAVHMDSLTATAKADAGWVDHILRRHPDTGVAFIGTPNFENGFEPNADTAARVLVLDSKLSTDDLIQICSQTQWLIAGESKLVDLSSLLNNRILYLSENGAQQADAQLCSSLWRVNGPYGNNHIVLENADAAAIYGVWSYSQSEWFHKGTFSLAHHFENLGSTEHLQNVSVYRSRIRTPQEGGGVTYDAVAPDTFTFESWMIRVRGQMARAWFCGWLPSIDLEIEKMKLSPALISKVRALQDSVNVLAKLGQEGKRTANELYECASNLKSGNVMSVEDRTFVEECGKKLLEVEGLISRTMNVEPELKGILKFYQTLMHNLTGSSLASMAKESAQAFELMDEGVELISIYIEKTLARAKPKSVSKEAGINLVPKTPI